jgi:TonB family protein
LVDVPDPKASAAPLNIGRYQVTDRLGEGGMGVVYLARDTSLERFVAIKLLRAGFNTADLRARFVKEARAVASLRHPCIVTVYEYGDHDGQPFIVMEYVNGKTLLEMIRARTPMSFARRMQLTRDLCLGLEHAHKVGIIHRDIKPANIMVDGEGTLKILDFGIAKLGHTGTTQISALVGTPRYMAPEQISGKPVTRRSDIFSVGLVIYELIAGRPAFNVENQFEAMNAIVNHEPVPLVAYVPDLDPRVVRIVEKTLEKDPDRRFQDLSQMRREVERICNELAVADPQQTATILRPSPPAQLDELTRRRGQQIAANLENAERAFERGDYDAGLAACEDALIIEPREPRALEGLQRAHAALTEREALGHLNAARQQFASNELTLAEESLRTASELAPALHELAELHEQLGSARQKKEQRARALKLALDRARIRFDEGAYESAINAANEALEYNPHDSEVRRLKAQALAGLQAEQQQREISRRAQVAADEASRLAARDQYTLALQVLSDAAIAGHPVVQDSRARIRSAGEEFDRLTREAAAEQLEPARREEAPAEPTLLDERNQIETVTLPWPPGALEVEAPPPSQVQPPAVPVVPAADHVLPPQDPRWLWSPDDPRELLPFPARRRRPPKVRKPVRFLDREADRGGAREWFHDQLFVGAKQGHDSVGFGVSLATHIAIAVVAIVAVISQATRISSPPDKKPPITVLLVPPPPPTVENTEPKPLERPQSKPRAPGPVRQPETPPAPPTPTPSAQASPTSSAPTQATPEAPIEAPPTLPTVDAPPVSQPVAVDQPRPPAVPGSPLPRHDVDGMVSEVPVDDFDKDPVIVGRVTPKVPVGASGRVRVRVTILPNGSVSRANVLDHTPYDALVIDAASRCTFLAARRRGQAVPVEWTITYTLETRQ